MLASPYTRALIGVVLILLVYAAILLWLPQALAGQYS